MPPIRYVVPALVLVVVAAIVGVVFAVANPFSGDDLPEKPLEDSNGTVAETSSPAVTVLDIPTFPPTKVTARTGLERPAPELAGITGWVNSEPFTLESQRGKVVLVDFWTYTCVNCIRTLPSLRSWHEKYAGAGLVVLGVHTPEFRFEKLRENVVDAVERLKIRYPVAQDNDYETWRAFDNRFWPAKYLIDRDGLVRYFHAGEGAYEKTERAIRELLAEAGGDLSGVSPQTPGSPASHLETADREAGGSSRLRIPALTGPSDMGLTRELYAGYERNYAAFLSQGEEQAFSDGYFLPYVVHPEYYEGPNTEVMYSDPGDHRNHYIYLQGLWSNGEQRLVHARQTDDYQDHVAIRFFASSVNAVMEPGEGSPSLVRLTLDARPLRSEEAGADVTFDEEGNSLVLVDESRMYGLVEMPDFRGAELRLASNTVGLGLFSFTFGAYHSGP